MQDLRLIRIAPIAGLAWIALVIVSVLLTGDQPGGDDSVQKFVDYFRDEDNRGKHELAAALAAVGGLAFFVFLAGLRELLIGEEGLWGQGTSLAFGAGVAFVVLLLAAAAAGDAFAAAAEFYDNFSVDGQSVQTAMTLAAFSFWLVIFASVAGAVMIGAASAVVLATGVLPRWVGWVGVALAVLSFLGAVFIPGVAVLLWVLLISIVLLTAVPRAGKAEALPPPD
jgi:hypothetical protein